MTNLEWLKSYFPKISHEQFDEIIDEEIEKQEKYRWHDLRENPEDLPNDIADCVLRDSDGNNFVGYYWHECGIDTWNIANPNWKEDYDWATPDEYSMPTTIIAWRYIEPFEEQKEEVQE